MQEEILSLRLRMSEQEEVLQGTIQRLRSTNRTKEHMELYIVNQREGPVPGSRLGEEGGDQWSRARWVDRWDQ